MKMVKGFAWRELRLSMREIERDIFHRRGVK